MLSKIPARPKVLAALPGFIPSTNINVITPLMDLYSAGLIEARITLEVFTGKKDIEWCDLLVLCRNTDPLAAGWFYKLLELRKPYIYDIDDNFFEIRGDSPLAQYHTNPAQLKMLTEYIRNASLVRVYSEPMFERAQGLNPYTSKVSAPVDFRLISLPEKRKDSKLVKIVYATSRPDDYLAEIFKPALKRIIKSYGDQIQVYFLGYNPPEFKEFPNVLFKPITFNYEQYLKSFSSEGYDIGLAPLLDDIFHRSKTNNKFREYSACRIAGIYSDVDVYSSCVINNKTGLLVKNNLEAWYSAIATLVENQEHRRTLQNNAYEFVERNYSENAFVDLWYQQIIQAQDFIRNKDNKQIYDLIFTLKEAKRLQPNLREWLSKRVKNNLRDLRSFGILFVLSKFTHYFQSLLGLLTMRTSLLYLQIKQMAQLNVKLQKINILNLQSNLKRSINNIFDKLNK